MADENSNLDDENSNNPACAACKHRRRKCILGKCILWDLFPAAKEEAPKFAAVQKIFGISNVTRIIQGLDTREKRAEAAEALKQEAMLWQENPVSGASGLISMLKRENEMLKGFIRQQLPQLQGRPLPFHHLPVPVSVYMPPSSNAFVRNSHQSCVLGNGNYDTVFQNTGYAANNGQMGFQNGVLQRHAIMSNQEIRPHERVEGYNGNNSNFGVGGLNSNNSDIGVGGCNGYRNVPGYGRRIDDMEARRIRVRNNGVPGHGVAQRGGSSGTEKSIHHQEGYNGNAIINHCSSASARGGYDSGRVVGVEAGKMGSSIANGINGGLVDVQGSSRQSIHYHGGYNDNVIVSKGYDSSRVVGMLARKIGSDIANGMNGGLVDVQCSSRTEQSSPYHGGYNGDDTTYDSTSNTNGRVNCDSGRMIEGTSGSNTFRREVDDGVVQIGEISRSQLLSPHQGGYGSNNSSDSLGEHDFRIVGMEAAGMDESNIVNGQSGEDEVIQTGSGLGLEQSTQQEKRGHVAGLPPFKD